MTRRQLRAIRKEIGLTQTQLASSLGVRMNTVSRWEQGTIPISRLTQLAVFYIRMQNAAKISFGSRVTMDNPEGL